MQNNIFNVSGLTAAFSGRSDGNMSLSYGQTENSLENRKNFLTGQGIDYRTLICAKQIHSSKIIYVTELDRAKGALTYDDSIADTDALITDENNLPLSIFTADCLSIFLYNDRVKGIGLVHAGWQSTKESIAAKTVQLMSERFNSKQEDLCAGFGPAIRGCCYRVGDEIKEIFPQDLIIHDNCYYLDLVSVNKRQLLESGVKEENIFDCAICTSCRNGEFFSYRKEGNNAGRMMSVMMLKEKGHR